MPPVCHRVVLVILTSNSHFNALIIPLCHSPVAHFDPKGGEDGENVVAVGRSTAVKRKCSGKETWVRQQWNACAWISICVLVGFTTLPIAILNTFTLPLFPLFIWLSREYYESTILVKRVQWQWNGSSAAVQYGHNGPGYGPHLVYKCSAYMAIAEVTVVLNNDMVHQ